MDHAEIVERFLTANWNTLVEYHGEKAATSFCLKVADCMLKYEDARKTVEELATGKRCFIIIQEVNGRLAACSNITGH